MRRLVTIAGACCAAGASTALAVGQGGQARAAPRAEPMAAPSHQVQAVVAALTRAAGAHPLAFPAARQFVHVSSVSSQGLVFSRHPNHPFDPPRQLYAASPQAFITWSEQTSTSPQRRGRTSTGPVSVHFPTPADRAAWVRIGRPKLTGSVPRSQSIAPAVYELGATRLTRAQLFAVANDPAAAYRRYLSRVASPATILGQVGAELGTVGFPPRLRTTVIRALALFPGVRAVDEPGRGAIGLKVAGASGGPSTKLIFDPTTATVTAIEQSSRFGFSFLTGRVVAIRQTTRFVQRTVTDARGVS
jgi:hypothetical protein